MEWSKEKTLLLIELLQEKANLWNPAISDSRKDKQKRKEELRTISKVLGITIADTSKKIQHLRTQYNREATKESRNVSVDDPDNMYYSNWYAFEYLHFLKDPTKVYKVLQENPSKTSRHQENEGKTSCDGPNLPRKLPKTDAIMLNSFYTDNQRDEYTVFGEYIANELRSLRGEKNLILAKKKIQDVIFEVKMGIIPDSEPEVSVCPVFEVQSATLQNLTTVTTQATPTSTVNEIINDHYRSYKVDSI